LAARPITRIDRDGVQRWLQRINAGKGSVQHFGFADFPLGNQLRDRGGIIGC
jgi:hypothetical protein